MARHDWTGAPVGMPYGWADRCRHGCGWERLMVEYTRRRGIVIWVERYEYRRGPDDPAGWRPMRPVPPCEPRRNDDAERP